MITHIIVIKLTWSVNDISNSGQANATMYLIIKVTYNITPGHKRWHRALQAKMGL